MLVIQAVQATEVLLHLQIPDPEAVAATEIQPKAAADLQVL